MFVVNPISDAIVKLVIVVVIVGTLLGLLMSGTDVLNPRTSAAKQRGTDEQTRHQNQLNALEEQARAEEQRHQAQLNALEEQKLVEQNKTENEHFRRSMALKLELLEIREQVLTAAGALALVLVAAGVAILLTRLGHRLSARVQPASHPSLDQTEDVWQHRGYRDAMIQIARANEMRLREALSQVGVTTSQAVSSNDGHRKAEPLTSIDAPNIST